MANITTATKKVQPTSRQISVMENVRKSYGKAGYSRALRGLATAQTSEIRSHGNVYVVPSGSRSGIEHTVHLTRNTATCSCEDAEFRAPKSNNGEKVVCRHTIAVALQKVEGLL